MRRIGAIDQAEDRIVAIACIEACLQGLRRDAPSVGFVVAAGAAAAVAEGAEKGIGAVDGAGCTNSGDAAGAARSLRPGRRRTTCAGRWCRWSRRTRHCQRLELRLLRLHDLFIRQCYRRRCVRCTAAASAAGRQHERRCNDKRCSTLLDAFVALPYLQQIATIENLFERK